MRAEQRASGRADHPPPPFLESDYYSPAPSPDAAIFFILGFGKNFWAIFLGLPIAPQDRHWMWASGHNGYSHAAHGYEATREAAMAAFAESWRRES